MLHTSIGMLHTSAGPLKSLAYDCSNLRVVTEVARSLVFSSRIQALADRVINAMTHGGQEEFNAVHLRIEKDARDWSTIMGGEAVGTNSVNRLQC